MNYYKNMCNMHKMRVFNLTNSAIDIKIHPLYYEIIR